MANLVGTIHPTLKVSVGSFVRVFIEGYGETLAEVRRIEGDTFYCRRLRDRSVIIATKRRKGDWEPR